jgi:hypothetical protein
VWAARGRRDERRRILIPHLSHRRRGVIPYSPTKPAPSGRPSVLRIPYRPTNVRPFQPPTRTAVETRRREEFPEEPPFSRKLLAGVIPYPPTRTAPNRAAFRYSTPRQRNTVLCNKRLPYRPTSACFFGHLSGARTSQSSENILQRRHFARTWVSVRRYRTLWQGMPYPRTNITVLAAKGYRTVQQGIPYRPTSFAVLCHKTWRTFPQGRATISLQNERKMSATDSCTLYLFFCYMFLCCLRMGISGK